MDGNGKEKKEETKPIALDKVRGCVYAYDTIDG